MRRSSLLLSAGLLALIGLACVPQEPSPPAAASAATPTPLVSPALRVLDTPPICPPGTTDGAIFANAVKMVIPFPPSTTVTPTPNGPVDDNMLSDLSAAFQLAPQFFRDELCGLSGVFVNPDDRSWGFRNLNTQKRYIAITSGLWNGNPHALPFRAYEGVILRALLKKPWDGPQHPPDNANDFARTVLAALAHEYGHVLWYTTFVPQPGGPANFDPAFDNFCGDGNGNFFTSPTFGTWQSRIDDEPPPVTPTGRWRAFGDPASFHLSDDIQVKEILDSIPPLNPHPPPPNQPDLLDAGKKLSRIYDPDSTGNPKGRWASFFASFSPEEDFVETFKLFVLFKAVAPLQSLPITIHIRGGPDFHGNIPATCASPKRPALQRKLSCFARAFCGPGAGPCDAMCTPRPMH